MHVLLSGPTITFITNSYAHSVASNIVERERWLFMPQRKYRDEGGPISCYVRVGLVSYAYLAFPFYLILWALICPFSFGSKAVLS